MKQLHQALDIVNYINESGHYHAFYSLAPHVNMLHIYIYESYVNYQETPDSIYGDYGYYTGSLAESKPLQPMLDELVQEFII